MGIDLADGFQFPGYNAGPLSIVASSNPDIITVTPTIDTSAYAIGDQLGGVQTIADAVTASGEGGVLSGVTVIDKAKQNASLQILIFNEEPTPTSSDNDAVDISDSEMEKCIGVIYVGSTYVGLANNSMAESGDSIRVVKADTGSTNLYAVPIIRNTATYGSSSDLIFRYKFLKD